jgi:hypothetical protein
MTCIPLVFVVVAGRRKLLEHLSRNRFSALHEQIERFNHCPQARALVLDLLAISRLASAERVDAQRTCGCTSGEVVVPVATQHR